MNFIIKQTSKSDFFQSENLTREAFWNLFKSGSEEHFVLHCLRNCPSYIAELDLIAIDDSVSIVGHVISTKAKVVDSDNIERDILCLGPICAHPVLQSKGIGSALIKETANIAVNLGYKGIILFGNPDYYRRFGFINAEKYGITTKEGKNFDPFMVMELYPHSLKEHKGKFYEDPAFFVSESELNEFDKQFPYKEKGKPKIDLSGIFD